MTASIRNFKKIIKFINKVQPMLDDVSAFMKNADEIEGFIQSIYDDIRNTGWTLVEHYNDRGGAANSLPAKILEEQRVDVDAVSGATASSKVIQEAVYNALTGKRTIK